MGRQTSKDKDIRGPRDVPSLPSDSPPTPNPYQPLDDDMPSAPPWNEFNEPCDPSGQDDNMGPPPSGPFHPGCHDDDIGPPPPPWLTPPQPPGNPPQTLSGVGVSSSSASQSDEPMHPANQHALEALCRAPPNAPGSQWQVRCPDNSERPAPYGNPRVWGRAPTPDKLHPCGELCTANFSDALITQLVINKMASHPWGGARWATYRTRRLTKTWGRAVPTTSMHGGAVQPRASESGTRTSVSSAIPPQHLQRQCLVPIWRSIRLESSIWTVAFGV